MRLGLLHRAEGYKPNLAQHLVKCLRYTIELQKRLVALQIVMQVATNPRNFKDRESLLFDIGQFRYFADHRNSNPVGEMAYELSRSGMVSVDLRDEIHRLDFDYRRLLDRLVHHHEEKGDVQKMLMRFIEEMGSKGFGFTEGFDHSLTKYVDFLQHEWDLQRGGRIVKKPD